VQVRAAESTLTVAIVVLAVRDQVGGVALIGVGPLGLTPGTGGAALATALIDGREAIAVPVAACGGEIFKILKCAHPFCNP